jgi:DNA polymerase-4/DNA polymerase V
MTDSPLTLHHWPRAILHVDADAFFASCEQAIHPHLRGRPVITGKERGIVSAASYEAKARGIERGMRLFEAKKVCPEVIMLPSDYETYSLFSLRMFEILRRFSPMVEEYSIDEAFVDLTGLRRLYHAPYEEIGRTLQETLIRELGIPFSVGISLTKVLAKLCSKYKKPRGFTPLPGPEIHTLLSVTPVEKVWGIGPNTGALLQKKGIRTALDFSRQSEPALKRFLSKPYLEIWHELNGRSVYPVTPDPKESYQSISKTRTFTPPSSDREFVWGQLAKNLENACIKARRYHLMAAKLGVILKRQSFHQDGMEARITRPTAYPSELLEATRTLFHHLFTERELYRATGIVLTHLAPSQDLQISLFEDPVKIEKLSKLYGAVDTLSARFGKHTVHHGASLPAKLQAQHEGDRGDVASRKQTLLKGENTRQRLGLPLWDVKV